MSLFPQTMGELIFVERMERIIQHEIQREKHRCPKCGELTYYSAPDTVFLHEGSGSYSCEGS